MSDTWPPFLPTLLSDIDILGQKLATSDIAVVLLLVILEGLLSIDNALVLGLLAKRLPRHQRTRALSYGLIGALVFRIIAISTASFLLRWTVVKFVGGAYLVYIAIRHLFFESQESYDDKLVVDATGQPVLVDSETGEELSRDELNLEIRERVPLGTSLVTGDDATASESQAATATARRAGPVRQGRNQFAGFWRTVLVIELTDIAFAVDSILAAMALAGGQADKLWLVITGGFLGVALMRFAAAIFIRLLERFPRFEVSAYLLVAVIGLKLLGDWGVNGDWSLRDSPWTASVVGDWKVKFENLESHRRRRVEAYENWLSNRWVFGMAEHSVPDPEAHLPPEVPRLLDFHDIRRPECMSFWLIMLACFLVGFMPRSPDPDGEATGNEPPSQGNQGIVNA